MGLVVTLHQAIQVHRDLPRRDALLEANLHLLNDFGASADKVTVFAKHFDHMKHSSRRRGICSREGTTRSGVYAHARELSESVRCSQGVLTERLRLANVSGRSCSVLAGGYAHSLEQAPKRGINHRTIHDNVRLRDRHFAVGQRCLYVVAGLSKYGVTDDFQVTVLTCQSGEYPELALLLGPVGSGAEGITLPLLKFVTV